jgi:sensor domain CHASE-containing protein
VIGGSLEPPTLSSSSTGCRPRQDIASIPLTVLPKEDHRNGGVPAVVDVSRAAHAAEVQTPTSAAEARLKGLGTAGERALNSISTE